MTILLKRIKQVRDNNTVSMITVNDTKKLIQKNAQRLQTRATLECLVGKVKSCITGCDVSGVCSRGSSSHFSRWRTAWRNPFPFQRLHEQSEHEVMGPRKSIQSLKGVIPP